MAFQFPHIKNSNTVETWKLQLFYLPLGLLFTSFSSQQNFDPLIIYFSWTMTHKNFKEKWSLVFSYFEYWPVFMCAVCNVRMCVDTCMSTSIHNHMYLCIWMLMFGITSLPRLHWTLLTEDESFTWTQSLLIRTDLARHPASGVPWLYLLNYGFIIGHHAYCQVSAEDLYLGFYTCMTALYPINCLPQVFKA